jgi:predicted TPR repeat methyltransferase
MSASAALAHGTDELAEAETLLNNGAVADAVAQLRAFIERNPKNAQAHILLARAAIAARTAAPALSLLAEAWRHADRREKLMIRALRGWLQYRQNLTDKALTEFRAVLERRGSSGNAAAVAVALHGMACLDHKRGASDEALARLLEAVNLAPRDRHIMIACAEALAERRVTDQALAAVKLAIGGNCVDGEVIDHAGVVMQKLGLFSEAERLFRVALALRPDDSRVGNNLGIVLYDQRRLEEAAAVFAGILAREPKNVIALHMAAALRGDAAPARASNEFVASTFDSFAATFDTKLVQQLGYKGPQQIGDALAPLLRADAALDVLDLGCGTGLCGPMLRPYARRLVGIDLSERMLAKARERGLYDNLLKAEVTEYLGRAQNAWDLVVGGDVFVYFGALEAVFAATKAGLRPGGRFAFTVERDDDPPGGWRLNKSGRYAHSADYLRKLAAEHGFVVESFAEIVKRYEGNDPVNGYVVVLRRD